ncbi:hypothetical protein [Winogradskya consettensis]|uniref:hypothetical protein n=1 Tax=Winogradskya consettensis TaxID=113560 RepID=UPI001BB3236E|nr:hypothetical protein [Actinoplanes consettensis]
MSRAASGSEQAGVTATNCLVRRGEKERAAPGKPALTALTGVTAMSRSAAASCAPR